MVNCIVYSMNYPAAYCNVSYIATQLADKGQTLYGFKGLLALLVQLPLREGSS